MSASLVGSEMCIRDREDPERLGRGTNRHRPVLEDLHAPAAFLHLVGPEAVSYTHLTLPTICSV
eukprot:1795050-Alexandrium_andersonii.AAC.1